MIAVLIALALSAEPKDCKDDRACFEAEAKTCKPVKLVRHAEKEIGGVRAKSSATTVVEGLTKNKCVVDYQAQVDEFHVGDESAHKLSLNDAAARAAYEHKMVEWSKTSPLAHLRCEVKPADTVSWLNRGLHSGTPPPYPSEVTKDCMSMGCDPMPKLAAGCSVATCTPEALTLMCPGASAEHPCVAKRATERPKGCVLGCNAAHEPECTK